MRLKNRRKEKRVGGWVWTAPRGLSVLNANWRERPAVRATGRGNSSPQHPGWPAYVRMDIFRHCSTGFLRLYLCFTAGIDTAKFGRTSICASAVAPVAVKELMTTAGICSAAGAPKLFILSKGGSFSLHTLCFLSIQSRGTCLFPSF